MVKNIKLRTNKVSCLKIVPYLVAKNNKNRVNYHAKNIQIFTFLIYTLKVDFNKK